MNDDSTSVESPRNQEPQRSRALVAALAAAGIVLALWGSNWLLLFIISEAPDRGLFGDMFGFSNSLFSGLALVGVIYAILVQREEMALARKELAYTKAIFDKQQSQLKAQNEATKLQAFENTYFNLLDLFAQQTANLDLERSGPDSSVIRGKDVFSTFLRDLGRHERGLFNEKGRTPTFSEIWDKFYAERNKELGHYFR